jgi:hypothetical protein
MIYIGSEYYGNQTGSCSTALFGEIVDICLQIDGSNIPSLFLYDSDNYFIHQIVITSSPTVTHFAGKFSQCLQPFLGKLNEFINKVMELIQIMQSSLGLLQIPFLSEEFGLLPLRIADFILFNLTFRFQ